MSIPEEAERKLFEASMYPGPVAPGRWGVECLNAGEYKASTVQQEWQGWRGRAALLPQWNAVLLLVNEYALHIHDAANGQGSKVDMAQTAALRTLNKLHNLVYGKAPA